MKHGVCSYGARAKCKFKHVKGEHLTTVMLTLAQEGDDMHEEVITMYQDKANAEQHPEMVMVIIAHKNGISLDSEPDDFQIYMLVQPATLGGT